MDYAREGPRDTRWSGLKGCVVPRPWWGWHRPHWAKGVKDPEIAGIHDHWYPYRRGLLRQIGWVAHEPVPRHPIYRASRLAPCSLLKNSWCCPPSTGFTSLSPSIIVSSELVMSLEAGWMLVGVE